MRQRRFAAPQAPKSAFFFNAMQTRELLRRIEAIADPRLAASWDHSGLQIAGSRERCSKLALALDPLPATVEQALTWGADVIVTHHPLALRPRLPNRIDDYHHVLRLVLGSGAWLYAAHTSLDVVTDGPPGWLAEALDLRQRRVLEPAGNRPFSLLRWMAPNAAAGDALVAALASIPRLTVQRLGDDLLEATCPETALPGIASIEAAHPAAVRQVTLAVTQPADVYGYGLIGTLPTPLTYPELAAKLATLLPRSFFVLAGTPPDRIANLAYCPGSGADMAGRAFAAGADVFLTGDLKYHQALEVPAGRLVVDVGHFALEEVMMRTFAADLATLFGPEGPTVRFFPGNDPFSAHFPDGALPPGTE